MEHANILKIAPISNDMRRFIKDNGVIEIFYKKNDGTKLDIIQTFSSQINDKTWVLKDVNNIPINFLEPRYFSVEKKIMIIKEQRSFNPNITDDKLGYILGIGRSSVREIISRYCPEYKTLNTKGA